MKIKYANKNFLDELNKSSLIDSSYRENVILNHQICNKHSNISILDIEYYQQIISNVKLYLENNPLTKKRVKDIIITPAVCMPTHAYAPPNKYLGISYKLLDENDKIFYQLKFSPYYFNQYERVEMNLGVVFKNTLDIYTLGNYKNACKHYTLAKVTNLSPSHIYIYAIDNMFFKNGLDRNHIGYAEDMKGLNEYAEKMNNRFTNLHLSFDEKGIISYNKKYKIRDVYEKSKDIKLNYVSSYYIWNE